MVVDWRYGGGEVTLTEKCITVGKKMDIKIDTDEIHTCF